MLILVRN